MAGVSDNENKEVVAGWIKELDPKRVLDVGAGMGIYSIMSKQPDQHWIALEVFAPYVEMFNLYSRYEEIIICDVRYFDWCKLQRCDLIILADMLEHMTKQEAIDVINEAMNNSDYVLICFPTVHHEQHAGHEGNTFETHVDHWTVEEMDELLKDDDIEERIEGAVLAYFLIKGSR